MNTTNGQPPVRKKVGRNGKYEKWLTEDGLTLLQGWARNGLTDKQIAKKCCIGVSTLNTWKATYQEIRDALKDGKEVIDIMVENALLKRALGFVYTETTTDTSEKGQTVRVVEKYAVPDTTAQIFWLKNRKRLDWRDNERTEIERERLEMDKRRLEMDLEEKTSDKDARFVIELGEGLEEFAE